MIKKGGDDMQYSVGVEYSLHCLLHLVDVGNEGNIGIKELAMYQGVSESYLSKIFTKLKKSGLLKSVIGVKSGYELAKPAEEISFWDVIEAIEGSSYQFQCNEIRQKEAILDPMDLPESFEKCPCLIKIVMTEAEEEMRNYLKGKSLAWLHEEVKGKLSKNIIDQKISWFKEN